MVNVFLIETPFQLLNAIEAKNYFELANNHLVIRLGVGLTREAFEPLIKQGDWDRVQYVTLEYENLEFESRLLGKKLSDRVRGYRYEYQQYANRRKLDAIMNSFGRVKNIFLGNYLKDWKQYMRHFANNLRYESLYLLDDGTDIIQVNNERKNAPLAKYNTKRPGSWFSRIKAMYHETIIDWNDKDAERVTFFTAYDLEVRDGDLLIRNEYRYLRKIAANTVPSDEILFLGQCLVEDRYMKDEFYLDYLRRIKEYFAGEKLVYVPHPRESSEIIDKIKKSLKLEIKRIHVPIEYEISIRGNAPKVLASFFCSALENCRVILGQHIKIKAFYLAPEHLLRLHANVRNIYEYFENNADADFEIVKL